MSLLLFYIFSAVALISAALVVILPRPTRALISLIVTMFSLSVLYLLLGAFFVAMAQIVVYAGAVLVLFLFVIMLQGIGAQEAPLGSRFSTFQVVLSIATGISFMVILTLILRRFSAPWPVGVLGTTEAVGRSLFKNYLLPFELTSLLLLVGVFAAIAIAKKEDS